MSKVLEQCKRILVTQRKDIRKLIIDTAREMKVSITETQIEKAVIYLKYGKAIW